MPPGTHEATVDCKDVTGMTPLMLAAKNGRLIQAELMLQFKPDVSLKDYTGRGPLGWARQSRNPQIVRLLERAGFFD
ncbi:MAG: ankyrin repeat domain-containing protein [Pseudomonadota bacterium]|nr:ankyrin repeat domain-containing protein [Pseudomonadota bacterium]